MPEQRPAAPARDAGGRTNWPPATARGTIARILRLAGKRHRDSDDSEWLATLRSSWGDAYIIVTIRLRRRAAWAALSKETGETIAARSPEGLLRAMSRDYAARVTVAAARLAGAEDWWAS